MLCMFWKKAQNLIVQKSSFSEQLNYASFVQLKRLFFKATKKFFSCFRIKSFDTNLKIQC